ncbi:MAG: hypothetical protein ABDH61_04110 [Acidilobaceae archaeon]
MRVKPSVVLAVGECLAVSASLDDSRVPVLEEVERAALAAFSGDEGIERLEGLRKVLAYNAVYGGLLLSYTCGPVVPISRAHVDVGIELTEKGEERGLSDSEILRAWALLYAGEEERGLGLIQGTTVFPVRLGWRVGKGAQVLPVGVEVNLSGDLPRSSSP